MMIGGWRMKQLLIGAALVGGAALLGRRGGEFSQGWTGGASCEQNLRWCKESHQRCMRNYVVSTMTPQERRTAERKGTITTEERKRYDR